MTSHSVIIFGATGGTGRHLVTAALQAGHHVTAFARRPDALDVQHPNLRRVAGDVADYAAVVRAMRGHDAVFCTLGAPAFSKRRVRTIGTQHIVRAMHESKIDRLVCLSVLGLGDSQGNLTFALKYLIIPLYLRRAFKDHAAQEAIIEQSGLSWTIVRPPHLTDGPATGRYKHGFSPDDADLSLKVSRADVAAFMLAQLERAEYVGRAPGISYARRAA